MEKKNTHLTHYDKQLAENQEKFLLLLESVGLPSADIFAPINERLTVFNNEREIELAIGKLSFLCQTIDINPSQHIANLHAAHPAY